jgi:hypothetical protein
MQTEQAIRRTAVRLANKGKSMDEEVREQRMGDVNMVALAFQPLDESSIEALLNEPS